MSEERGAADRRDLANVVGRALDEDAPAGDLTSRLIVAPSDRCHAELRAKADGVLAGTAAAQMAFDLAAERTGLGPVQVDWKLPDGDAVHPDDLLALVVGPAAAILLGERVAINFLAHLSGVATLTRAFAEAARPARILNTRKTTPGLRALEREAVVAGGGSLHRSSLSEAILIKDNHIRIAGGVGEAVRRARQARPATDVEVEVESVPELEEALASGADLILLDNPTPELVREAVSRVADPGRLEVSGGVSLKSVSSLVEAGARVISVGRITHSASSLDISLEVVDVDGL